MKMSYSAYTGKHYKHVPISGTESTRSEPFEPTREEELETALQEAYRTITLLYTSLAYVHENRKLLGNWDHYQNYVRECETNAARLGIDIS